MYLTYYFIFLWIKCEETTVAASVWTNPVPQGNASKCKVRILNPSGSLTKLKEGFSIFRCPLQGRFFSWKTNNYSLIIKKKNRLQGNKVTAKTGTFRMKMLDWFCESMREFFLSNVIIHLIYFCNPSSDILTQTNLLYVWHHYFKPQLPLLGYTFGTF